MKKTKFVLLSLLSLGMITGCNQTNTSSATPSSTTPSSTVASSLTPSSNVPSSLTPSSEKEPSSVISSSKETSSSTVVEGWSEDIKTEMQTYLNYILPYYKMDSYDYSFNYTYYYDDSLPYFYIDTDILYSELTLLSFKTLYTKNGFSISTLAEGNGFKATLSDHYLTVEILKGKDGYIVIKAVYDEPYDSSKLTAWSYSDKDTIHNHMHDHDVPFVNLGSKNPMITDSGSTLYFSGSSWNDEIYTNAQTNLANGGYTVAKNPKTTSETDFMADSDVITATKTMDDKCVITIKVGKYVTNGRPLMTATLTEAFNPEFKKSFDEDETNYLNDKLDNQASYIPFVYLGTVYPTFSQLANKDVRITGGIWNDQVLTLAATAFADWTVTTSTVSLKATFKNENGYLITINVYSLDGVATMDISLHMEWDPSSCNSWNDDVKDMLDTNYSDYSIPYVYMGTSNPTCGSTPFIDYHYIKGDLWNVNAIKVAKDSFSKYSDYKASNETKTSITFTSKVYDDNSYILINFYDNSDGLIEMDIYIKEAFTPSTYTAWEESITNAFATTLDNHVLPVIYLGAKSVSVTTGVDTLTIKGGEYNDLLISNTESVLTADGGWTLSTETVDSGFTWAHDNTIVVATKTFEDKHTITLRIGKSYDSQGKNKCMLIADMTEPYDPTTISEWGDSKEAIFKNNLDGHTIPFVYADSRNPYVSYSELLNAVSVVGGTYVDQFITDATTTLTTDSWTVTEAENDPTSSLDTTKKFYVATKTMDDECNMSIYFGCSKSGKAVLVVYNEPAFVPDPTITDWSEDVTTTFSTNLDNHAIPYFYMGASEDISAKWQTSSNRVYLQNKIVNSRIFTFAKEAFEKATWTVITGYDTNNNPTLTAKKKFDDTHTISFSMYMMKTSYSTYTYAYLQMSNEYHVDTSVTSWNEDTLTTMNTNLDNHAIPFFYVGKDDEITTNYAYPTVTVNGCDFDEGQVLTEAKNAFNNATGWTLDETVQDQLTATQEYDDDHIITATLKKSTKGKINFAIKMVRKYVVDTSLTDWDETTTELFNTNFNDHVVPYFYIGKPSEYLTKFGTYSKYILGNDWDSAVLTEAKKVLNATNNWTVNTDSASSYAATYVYDDGCKLKISIAKDYTTERIKVSFTFTASSSHGDE